MRYYTEIMKRYAAGFDLRGAAKAQAEGWLNTGLFAAGMAANEAIIRAKSLTQKSNEFFFADTYEDNLFFADIEFRHHQQRIKLGLSTLIDHPNAQLLRDSQKIIAPPPLVSFKRSKNIGVTVIDDGDEAEIVENFGINSWDIDINGMLVDMENHQYPKDSMQKVSQFFEINDVIEVISPLFQDLGINSLYFREQTIVPMEGFPDTIKYSLAAKSIKPAEFFII